MNNITKISTSLLVLFSVALTQTQHETHSLIADSDFEFQHDNHRIDGQCEGIDDLDFLEQETTIEEFTQQLINLIIGILENQRSMDENALNEYLTKELNRIFSTYNALITVSFCVHRAPTMPEQSTLTPERQEALNNLVEMFVSAASIATNTKDRTNVVTNVVSMAGNLAKIIMSAVEARQANSTRRAPSNTLALTINL